MTNHSYALIIANENYLQLEVPNLFDVILDTLLDTLKTMPFLFVVYFILEFLHKKMRSMGSIRKKSNGWGPLVGALTGCFPQCGFSAAAASLYSGGAIGAGTLIAVFISTSDAALPIFLSHASQWGQILPFLAAKVALALIAGYVLQFTVFRRDIRSGAKAGHEDPGCGCSHEHASPVWGALAHTLKISAFMAGVLLVINLCVFWIGQERVGAIFLEGSLLQPILAALIGLIPGCGTSVILTELYLSGTLSFGAAVAGLSTGAGFGFLVLFRENRPLRDSLRIAWYSYLCAALGGVAIQQLFH